MIDHKGAAAAQRLTGRPVGAELRALTSQPLLLTCQNCFVLGSVLLDVQICGLGRFCELLMCLPQLDLITDLLGTPPLSALASACEGARAHILRGPHKPVRKVLPECLQLDVCSPSVNGWKLRPLTLTLLLSRPCRCCTCCRTGPRTRPCTCSAACWSSTRSVPAPAGQVICCGGAWP